MMRSPLKGFLTLALSLTVSQTAPSVEVSTTGPCSLAVGLVQSGATYTVNINCEILKEKWKEHLALDGQLTVQLPDHWRLSDGGEMGNSEIFPEKQSVYDKLDFNVSFDPTSDFFVGAKEQADSILSNESTYLDDDGQSSDIPNQKALIQLFQLFDSQPDGEGDNPRFLPIFEGSDYKLINITVRNLPLDEGSRSAENVAKVIKENVTENIVDDTAYVAFKEKKEDIVGVFHYVIGPGCVVDDWSERRKTFPNITAHCGGTTDDKNTVYEMCVNIFSRVIFNNTEYCGD